MKTVKKISAHCRDTPDSGKTGRTHCCSTWNFRGTSSRCCTGWRRSLSHRKPPGNSPVFGGHLSGDRSRSDWRSKRRCYYPGVCSTFAGTDSCRQILQRTPGPRWALPRELDKHRRGSAREKYRKPTGIKTKCCRRHKSILEKTFSDTKYGKKRNKNRRKNQSTAKKSENSLEKQENFFLRNLEKNFDEFCGLYVGKFLIICYEKVCIVKTVPVVYLRKHADASASSASRTRREEVKYVFLRKHSMFVHLFTY